MAQDLGAKTSTPSKGSTSKRNSGVSLHVADSPNQHTGPDFNPSQPPRQQQGAAISKPSNSSCACCKGQHLISRCHRFQKLSLQERERLVKRRNLCFNCLRSGHSVSSCFSRFRCRACGKKHHSLIHADTGALPPGNKEKQDPLEKPESFTGFGSASSASSCNTTVLLGTVQLRIKGPQGRFHQARAVLDSGSQHTFITSSLAHKLGAKVKPFGCSISSLGGSAIPPSTLKGITSCHVSSSTGDKEFKISPVVVDSITSSLPSHSFPPSVVQRLSSDSLADKLFGTPAPIDILIGADLYGHVVSGAPFPTGVADLFYLPTIFGLVVSGALHQASQAHNTLSLFVQSSSSLQTELKAFWELEEPSPVDRSHPDDKFCEDHFLSTHTRTAEGRYVVRLPFKSDLPELGTNKQVALRRLYSLEARFRKDHSFAERYQDFMAEYFDLGHMSSADNQVPYLIPHHGVWQENPQGRKLRVVFDASCPSSKTSLNDVLHAGPKLQEDICMVLIRFRLHSIAICADLVKMYRQVLIHPYDRRYQHILWREDPSAAIQEMELKTVTYGIKSSAFHALRVIRQLVHDEGEGFPLAAEKIPGDMYVDDIVTGADSIQEATQLVEELNGLFGKGGFSLGKWASSIPNLVPSTSSDDSVNMVSIQPPNDDCIKILGLFWNPTTDAFSYSTRDPPSTGVTKRTMLSAVARIYDPLGLLAPLIFSAKVLIQELWKRDLDWDDKLPDELQSSWNSLISEWSILSSVSIPRYISNVGASHQLIGFCDASVKGYAAALFLRSESKSGEIKVALIKAKSKVAPLRFHSIARLELCGALLLSRLVSSVPLLTSRHAVCFTDSQVVLSWLRTPTHELKVFEANRVSQILKLVPLDSWRHVPSEENPADIASRGSSPLQLKSDLLWWNGPNWLMQPVHQWYQPSQHATALSIVSTSISPDATEDWTTRFSSFQFMIRTTARILRFMNSARSRSARSVITNEPISASEFLDAELRCAAFVQRTYLPKSLYSGKSKLPHEYAKLLPFVDQRGLVRVGGRLQESALSDEAKHPILIPYGTHFSRLLVDHIHSSNFHAGATLCLSVLRSKYWVPRATRLIRGRIQRCVPCRLRKAKPITPLMAPLPKGRFQQGKVFSQVGVDFAGPFLIKESRRRNASLGKAYISLFICLSSKALHLELVSALSTPAFLAALDRFIARRGVPSVIWSDNATNFIGASRFIRQIFKQHREDSESIQRHLSPRGIQWKFIPPRAPHFGGLWEAGVKSVKSLLSSTVGKQPYTFEELTTVLLRIEALLNSRPLCPLTEDVDNLEYLTPGHFILGVPLTSLPASSETPQLPSSIMTRWNLIKDQIQHVWNRWSKDYLHTLQQRSKWIRRVGGLKVGDLVILIERRLTVGQWPVARVIEVLPGRDGITRTVTVRTPSGNLLTRAVTSLAPLLIPDEESS